MSNHKLSVLAVPAEQAARRLLGCELIRTFDDGTTARVRIVETEAYDQTDAASHSYKPATPRTAIMFGPAGYVYVYFTYGMHYCMNVVCGQDGEGAAVLIRAVEPIHNEPLLQANRGGRSGIDVTNGPAKTCQALQITKQLNGHHLTNQPLQLKIKPALSPPNIIQTTRIGISQAKDVPWRFYIKNNPYVSRP